MAVRLHENDVDDFMNDQNEDETTLDDSMNDD